LLSHRLAEKPVATFPRDALESGSFMSTHHEFYLERAAEARRDADATQLQNVRDRCLRAAEAWEQMAARVERTGRMRAETEAKKAAALVAEAQ
jgi:hypothetical protein